MTARPSNFRIYRPKVALELSLLLPKAADGGTYLEPGRLFASMAAGVAREKYNWAGALRLCLTAGELGELLTGLDGAEVSIIHDPGAGTQAKGAVVKAMKVRRGDDGRMMVSMGSKANGGPWASAGTVGLSPSELATVRELIRAAIPVLLGWVA